MSKSGRVGTEKWKNIITAYCLAAALMATDLSITMGGHVKNIAGHTQVYFMRDWEEQDGDNLIL